MTVLADELVLKDSNFTRPDLARAVASWLGEGATVATVDRVTSRVLASPQVVPVHDDDTNRWTSAAHLAVERRFLDTVTASRHTRRPLTDTVVEAVLRERPSIGANQAAAVRALAAGTDAVSVLVGPAGTGKTYTLDAIAAAYQAGGWRVVGAAPTGRAALELEAGADIPASTLHRLAARWGRGDDIPGPGTLLVIDEAGMAAIGDLEPLVTRTVAAGGRVLLAGDHRQLPEVNAGGGFGALATTRPTIVATLTTNRRQTEAWERDALTQLRDGHIPEAVDAYRSHGRVVAVEDRTDMVATAVDLYATALEAGHRPVLLAGTNELVDALNDAVRHHLTTIGQLPHEPVAASAGRGLAVGDRVVLRHTLYNHPTTNPGRDGIFNAEAATITGPTPDGGVTVRLHHDHAHTTLPGWYLAAGHVTHAYALTTHRAQGGTWDVAIAVGTEGLYQEAGYTQLSRGRHTNRLVLTRPELDDLDTELARHDHGLPHPTETTDPLDDLTGHLERSRAKLLALTRDPHADHVNTLATTQPLTHLEHRAAHARAVEQQATQATGVDPHTIGRRLDRARHTAQHLAIGHRVRALDRGNIGTITGHDDHAGTVTVHFQAPDGREATKDLDWADVHIVTPRDPAARQLPVAAQARLDTLTNATRAQVERWHAHLAHHGIAPLEAQHHERAARLAIDRTAAHLAATPPAWLLDALGPRPSAPYAAQAWDDATRTAAAHHTRHHLPLDHPDPTPPGTPQAAAWHTVTDHLQRTRTWITTLDQTPHTATRTRSTTELLDRIDQLDAHLATAPPDQRALIHQLLDTADALTGDTAQQLADALDRHQGRKDWILANWPYVVEHAEATRTLTTGTPGPPLQPTLLQLATHENPHLAHAASHTEPWLTTLAPTLANPTGHLTHNARTLLADIATHRHHWHIDHPHPLGLSAADPEHAAQRHALANRLSDLTSQRTIDSPRRAAIPDAPDGISL